MKRLVVVFAALLFLAWSGDVSAQQSGGTSQPSDLSRFVGFTDEATNALPDSIEGRRPISALHELCRDDFGSKARMCSTGEFFLSPGKRGPSTPSWIVPTPVLAGKDSGNRLYCGEVSETGLVVLPEAKLHEGYCNVSRPVTCCAPVS